MKWIKYVILKTLDQTKKIANHLEASSVRDTCRQIWAFCFHHFQYEKDEKRKEQIRTPSRSWYDRTSVRGIDCDCFSTLIGSILTNLNIPFVMRLARYKGADFEHIYPVAFDEEGQEVIIDAVVYSFDYEVAIPPQGQLKDVEMDLEILNGAPDDFSNDLPIDAEGLFWDDDEDLEGLDGRAEREARKASRKAKKDIPKSEKKAKRKENRQQFINDFKKGNLKDKIRSGIHVLNKANPVTLLLRGGVLASMKLNLFKVASRLRFAYWTEEQARANDMDMAKFNQLQRIREKVEKIYFRAGGKPASLKKAMLSGKGNRNKMVSLNGLGSAPNIIADEADMRTILGEELYSEEFELNGLNGLGEVATAAAVTAASGAMGIIAGLLKKLGGLFKKGSRGDQKFQIQDNGDNADEKTRKFSFKNIGNKVRTKIQERRARKNGSTEENEVIKFENDEEFDVPEEEYIPTPEEEFLPQNSQADNDSDGSSDSSGESDTQNKESGGVMNWIKNNKGLSVGIGVGSLAAIGGTIWGIKAYKKSKTKKSTKSMSGVPKKKTKTTKASTGGRKPKPKTTRKSRSSTRPKAPVKKLREIKLP
ncbi:MAG: hypothetical protein GQ574_26750 [Crocinitomix sp.]|nr:hypothetical protein [Crocinitomix sp.]